MKYTLYIICLLVFSFTGSAQSKCAQVREGKFKVTDPKTKKVCLITREGETQTEKLEEAEEAFTFDIKWLDDCTYTLTPTAATLARNKDVKDIGTMTVKITQVKEDSYTHKVTVANNPKFKRVDEVFVVKDDK
jgi:hypothetical protein